MRALGDGNDEGVVLRDAHLLKGVPGTLVRGSLGEGSDRPEDAGR
ncbi:hypothetical protein [Streptomyces sp. NPDC007205]